MDFRYKTDKQGKDNIANTYRLDLYVVKIWIDVNDAIIYDIYNTQDYIYRKSIYQKWVTNGSPENYTSGDPFLNFAKWLNYKKNP